MALRFGRFELDEACRELRLDGEPWPLQPLVFSLLCYLVRHRDRAIGKDELLDQLWPDTFVTESSLQKAVSLARSALRQGKADDAIRTLPRQGYRFVAEVDDIPDRCAPTPATDSEAWLAQSLQTHIGDGNRPGAVAAAIQLARLALNRMELSTARGFTLRAERVLGEEARTREWGLVHSMHGRIALYAGDHEECLRRAEITMELGRELGDPEIEVLGLIDSGHSALCLGDAALCIAHHDEAAALAMSGGLDPEIAGLVYCSVIWASSNRGDWRRANEWTNAYTRWCEAHPVSYYPGLCRLHRAEVFQQKGDLPAARREIEDATELLDRAAPWAAGEAHRVQGQILLDTGDLAGAEVEFRRALEFGWEPQPGYAWLLFAQGQAQRGLRGLRRAIDSAGWGTAERRNFLRVEEVSLALASGEPAVAQEALACLRSTVDPATASDSLRAELARAEGEMALHEQRFTDAIEHLRSARDGWLSVGSPPNAARARLKLAEAHDARGDEDLAAVERESLRATVLPMGFTLGPH